MGRLLIDPSQRIVIQVFIDLQHTIPKIVQNICPLSQGEEPCRSIRHERCFGKWDLCDDREHCGDTIGRQREVIGKLRGGIETISLLVSPETFGITNYAEMQSYETDAKSDRYFNVQKYRMWKFRLLLKSWDLDKIDPELKIDIRPKTGNQPEMLSDDFMKKILQLPGAFMRDLITVVLKQVEMHSSEKPHPN